MACQHRPPKELLEVWPELVDPEVDEPCQACIDDEENA